MNASANKEMVLTVARALGQDLIEEVAFVGGCTTSLLITDETTLEDVRYTDDVDLIVSVIGYAGWDKLRKRLEQKGFRFSQEDDVFCRMRLGELKVDFMPDNPDVLHFSNLWYSEALSKSVWYELDNSINIRLVTPPYFLATKFEAYKGRGNDDPIASTDIEDIIILFDGRETLVQEIRESSTPLRLYISSEVGHLLKHSDIQYAVEGNVKTHGSDRAVIVFERLEEVAEIAS